MRSYLPSFELHRAASLDEALTLLAHRPSRWKPFAGGTDLMVMLGAGALTHQQYVSIWGIEELRAIVVDDDAIAIGALATFTDLQRHPVVRRELPLLCTAAAEIGGIANQNRATVGGNIGNASPAADSPPALVVFGAEVELASQAGRRRVPLEQFHTGYKQMDMRPDEMIVAIRVPRRSAAGDGWIGGYRKVGARRAQAIAKVCFAARMRVQQGRVEEVRIAYGSMAPTIVRAARAEDALRGARLTDTSAEAALLALDGDLSPIDDIRSTARYRRDVARNLLREFLGSALGS